jgi:hypothetical protein
LSLYVGPISGRSEPSGEPHVLVEAAEGEGSRRRDHHRGKPTGVAKAALDDVKPCESIGIAPVPTAVEAARSKS